LGQLDSAQQALTHTPELCIRLQQNTLERALLHKMEMDSNIVCYLVEANQHPMAHRALPT
jgi:hypothetical protein